MQTQLCWLSDRSICLQRLGRKRTRNSSLLIVSTKHQVLTSPNKAVKTKLCQVWHDQEAQCKIHVNHSGNMTQKLFLGIKRVYFFTPQAPVSYFAVRWTAVIWILGRTINDNSICFVRNHSKYFSKMKKEQRKKAQLVCWFVLSMEKINAAVPFRNTIFRAQHFYANMT